MNNLFKGKKILIVEDDFSSRFYLNKVLEKTGADIFNAENGKDAVDMIRKQPDIDLILMDIQMPVLDGYAAIALIKEFNTKVTIIAQTAYGMISDKEKIKTCGFDNYLIKPITYNQLIDKLSQYLINHSE